MKRIPNLSRWICLSILLSVNALSAAQTSESSVDITPQAQGMAQLLLKRADANIFYLFERSLLKDGYLECFMPATFDMLTRADENGRLKRLLRSTSADWDAVVNQDLRNTEAKFLLILTRQMLNDIDVVAINDQLAGLVQALEVNIGTEAAPEWYSLAVEPLHATAAQRKIYDEFYALSAVLQEVYFLKQIQAKVKLSKNSCLTDLQLSDADAAKVENSLKTLTALIESPAVVLQAFANYSEQGKLRVKGYHGDLTDLLEKAMPDFASFKNAKSYPLLENAVALYLHSNPAYIGFSDDIYQAKDKNLSYVDRLDKLVAAMKLVFNEAEAHDLPLPIQYNEHQLNRFIKHAEFFAELADAKDADTVEAILQDAMLPDVSFGVKRTPGEQDWLITSYLGVSVMEEKDVDLAGEEKETLTGLFAPVGIEWTFSKTRHGSFSAMLAPFDFGHAVNREIYNPDEDTTLGDVVVPGFYLSWGVRDYPVTIGVGVNRGNALLQEDEQETRALLFFALDMPLFSLW